MLGANGICVPKQRVVSLDRTLSGKEVKFNTQASIARYNLPWLRRERYTHQIFFKFIYISDKNNKMALTMRLKIQDFKLISQELQ
jgi:hypothetical protein